MGESERNLKVRIVEHRNVKSGSALSIHLGTGIEHQLLPDQTQIVNQGKHTTHRKILESIACPLQHWAVCGSISNVVCLST